MVDDYRTLPATGPRRQLVDGALTCVTPTPSRYRHQALQAELLMRLRSFVRTHGLGDVVGAPIDVYLPIGSAAPPTHAIERQPVASSASFVTVRQLRHVLIVPSVLSM